jgi:uncharacterized protein DUF4330/IPT/TIG domain-containing protein
MPLIDDHGRLFGRLNLIDALVGLFVLVLVPVGYGALLLFRTPPPTITAITPAQVPEKQPATVAIVGTDLRAFLKARIGQYAAGFLVQSPTRAEIKIPDGIPAGTYDLVLADEAQELVRKPGAISVVAPAAPSTTTQVQLAGEFIGLSAAIAPRLQAAATPAGEGQAGVEVLAIRSPQPGTRTITVGTDQIVVALGAGEMRVPAIVRVGCVIADNRCTVAGTAIAPDAVLTLTVPIAAGAAASPQPLAFRVTSVRASNAPASFAAASIRVRFVARPEVAQALKAGDLDVAAAGAIADAELARLTAIDGDRQSVTATASVIVAPGQSYQVPQQAVAFTGTVRVPVVATASGWQYKSRTIRIGAPFTFETAAGFVQGWIAEMTLAPAGSR